MPSYDGVLLSAVVLAALTIVHSQQIKDACYQAPKFVQCDSHTMREYWYNSTTKRCHLYATGSCAGNDNHFKYQEECLRNCTLKTDVCKEPGPTGMCRAAFPRWYYDATTGRCDKFTYGGCNPNANNFETLADCERYNC